MCPISFFKWQSIQNHDTANGRGDLYSRKSPGQTILVIIQSNLYTDQHIVTKTIPSPPTETIQIKNDNFVQYLLQKISIYYISLFSYHKIQNLRIIFILKSRLLWMVNHCDDITNNLLTQYSYPIHLKLNVDTIITFSHISMSFSVSLMFTDTTESFNFYNECRTENQ